MEKILKLFTYVDGRNDTPFPNEQEQVVVSEFRGDYKRMGATPTISCTVMHHKCLDKLWTDNVYATFNGEKFFIKQTASSSYDNTDSRYKHEVELVSERIILDNVYFYDVVQSDVTNDKPVSNSSNVVFFGDIHEFANRLNYSLQYSNVGYSVVVDDGISSEGKMMSFQNQFFSNVLQEIYNTYEIPYYFVGKVIHIGYTNNAITHTFKYGVDESLLSIQKQNANYKLVNRVTGVGSADNIPYYYPNDYESKEEVEANGGTWINPQPNLMPSVYRDTLGKERFYKALNNTYVSPQTGEYYYFENPFVEGKPKEHIVDFENIKPSIKGMLNASNQRMDMFVDFAYDADDNDETDEEGNYLHPYFFAKLRKFDGNYGFNLFDHAIDEQEMVISMTSGSCGACEWVIGVDEESQKNTVQVNSSGNLVRDDKGNIKFGTPQDRQNDTRNYEVWVALKKDINTFGVIMPNASSNYKPSVNDTFVILHIDLPKAYILSAENNLKEQLIKYMAMNNSEKFTFSISFSRIFFAENPQILAQLNENARIQIEYDNTNYELYVSSYSYNMSNGSPLPEIKVELSDTLSVQQNALQNAISEVKQDIMSSVGSGDFLQQGLRYFLRKDTSDRTRGKLSSDVGFEVGRYVSGASGAIIYKDSSTGQTIGEVDKLYVRMKAYFETLVISEVGTISGKQIISPAGSIKCIGVDEIENAYRCYFLGEQDGSETSNLFHVNDQAYSQTFNAKEGVNNKIANTYYWRLITNVSSDLVVYKNQKCHYIDLSKTDCDQGSDIPKEGDIINHRGSRNDIDRMNFIESSSVDAFSPNITLFHGVNSYSLDGKDYVSYGVDKTTNKAYMNVYGDMFVGDRNGSTYMRYTPEGGLVIKGKLDIETKLGDSTLKDLISASTPEGYQEFVEKVTQDIEGLQQQIDGAIESYFYQYEPTLSNYPASSWDTKKLKDAHLNNTFTNLVDGRSWRWTIENGNYKWTEITDTATTQALALAGQAQDTADGKRRVFVAQPKPPYDKGDLWSRGKDYPLLLCVNAKGANGSYDESDWDYADNTEKLQKELEDLVNDTKDELNNAIGQATEAANTYTDNAKSALQTSINELNNAKANVNDVYTKAQADGLISKAEEDAINSAKQQADAAIALSETIVKAYADGVVDAEEAARIKQAQENLDTAKAYAEQKAQEALNSALSSLSTFNYLKAALKEDTSIEGGLIQSSLIKLGYTSSNTFKVMSGSNGIYNSSLNGGGIASWWGGDTYDLLDYYNWDGTQWVKKSGVTVPSNIPSGLIRFDGTGYFAKGKFWWDNNGEIHADPTALLLSFDVVTGDETLASTIINIRKDLASFMDMWEVKKLSDGTEYLYSKRHLATNGGVTMYALDEITVDSIIDSLPLASTSQYGIAKFNPSNFVINEDGFVTIIGGSGGLDTEELAEYLATNKYATQGWVEGKGYITSSALNGYATQSWVTNQKYITGITSAMVVSALGFTPYNSANFTKANIKSTLGISDWALASTKPSYNFSEIGTKPTTIAGYGITDAYTTQQADALYAKYLPLTGGTLSGDLVLKSSTKSSDTPKIVFQRGTSTDDYYDSYILNQGGSVTFGISYRSTNYNRIQIADKLIRPTTSNSYAIGSDELRFSNVYSVLGNYSGEVSMQSANINGGKITYDTTNKYFKLEGDLLVTGGVSMYSDDSEFTPSTIMDGVVVDGTSIRKNPTTGALEVIGGSGATVKYPLSWSGFNQGSYDGSVAQSFYIPTKLSEFVNDKSFATTSDLGNYLPLSGGTIKTEGINGLTIKRSSSDYSVIRYTDNTELLGYIGVGSASNLYPKQPVFIDSGIAAHKIWHSGNDGSDSGLDADTLDGLQPSELYVAGINQVYQENINFKVGHKKLQIISPKAADALDNGFPNGYSSGLSVISNYVGWQMVTYGGSSINNPYFRKLNDTNVWSDWKQLAFLTDNVASATKLQTSRTIWGQSFDGTGNVDGSLVVNNSTSNGDLITLRSKASWSGILYTPSTGISWSVYANNNDNYNFWNSHKNEAVIQISKTGIFKNLGIGDDGRYASMSNGGFGLHFASGEYAGGLAAYAYNETYLGEVAGVSGGGNTLNYYYYGGTYNSPSLTINKNKNVGIGTTSPAYKLDVNGISRTRFMWFLSTDGSSNAGYIGRGANNNNTIYVHSGSGNALHFGSNGIDSRLILDTSGNVGIGTTSPATKLFIKSDSSTSGDLIRLKSSTTWSGIVFEAASGYVWSACANTTNEFFFWNSHLGYNALTLSSTGNLLVQGGITMYSDIRKKTKLQDVELNLSQIANAPLIQHYYNSDDSQTTHVGSIAQYWAGLNDWFCKLDADGFYTMEIQNAALASAISIARHLEKYESKTDKKIRMLKKRITELEDKVERLKKGE